MLKNKRAVKIPERVDINKVKQAGVGTKILGKEALQIVIGTNVEHVVNGH